MNRVRKDLPLELDALKSRIRALIRDGTEQRCLSRKLLGEQEQRIEDYFVKLGSMQTIHEEICRKFRKAIPESTRPWSSERSAQSNSLAPTREH